MSDFGRVKATLRRAARDGAGQSGRVEYVTARDGVARILDEVDVSVLGQRLGFEFDDGSCLRCEASGRRLLRLLAPRPPGLTKEQMALFDRDELAADTAPVLSSLFVRLCERGAGFSRTAEPIGGGADPAPGGVEPAAIAEAAGLPVGSVPETGEATPHAAFLDALRPMLRAAILIDGDDSSLILGGEEEAALLVDWVENSLVNLLSPGFALLGTLETNGILVFDLSEAAGRHMLVAGRRGSLLVATVKGGDAAATLNLWRTHSRSRSA
ncbi:hypothetical protein [Defluviimonas sp. SAOS-178_SWC]|uniref:hypothetical protein n=1 Tax=Defluviimonas sp. SAOS-178_SWC TaxID=3121287 RepID=UPI0032215556